MVLGPILLIVAFLLIARRNDATLPADEDDDWDADLGDLPTRDPGPDDARSGPGTPFGKDVLPGRWD